MWNEVINVMEEGSNSVKAEPWKSKPFFTGDGKA